MAMTPPPSYQRIARFYRQAGILCLNTLILLLLIEGGAAVALKILNGRTEKRDIQTKLDLSYYAAQEWSEAYWTADYHLESQYYPYVIWRGRPLQSDMIQVDAQGFRHTPGTECEADAYTVFAFGGSTMWGVGSPDWGTIPAYLQQQLAASLDTPVCVHNFGERAFVSTQSLIQLEQQLQQGNIPDLVIFYDGINDVATTYQTNEAGTHFHLHRITYLVDLERETSLATGLQATNTVKLVNQLAGRLNAARNAAAVASLPPPTDLAQLSQDVAHTYLTNYEIVALLAHKYHFDYHFFWQPVAMIGEKPLTAEEAAQLQKNPFVPYTDLYQLTYQRVDQLASQHDHLHYIADVFDEYPDFVWIDGFHVTPEGNQLVAARMIEVMAVVPDDEAAAVPHTLVHKPRDR